MHADSLTSQTDATGHRLWYRTEDELTNVLNACTSKLPTYLKHCSDLGFTVYTHVM